MRKQPVFTRPVFDQACKAWQEILREHSRPTECLWLFEENFCFEKSNTPDREYSLAFQTRFTPPPQDAAKIAYHYFSQFEDPVVFYRVGSSQGKSLCTLLCDSWFEPKGPNSGYLRRDDWLIQFYPGDDLELEEVTDEKRWAERILKGRPVAPLDFVMTLRAIHETLAHGRVLTPYEHYALRFLKSWSQFLPNKNRLDN
jgi:hypothetical protein